MLIPSERFSLDKCGKIWKNQPIFRADMVELGNTAWADMVGLVSIGLIQCKNALALCTSPW